MIDYRSGLMILGGKTDRKTDNVGPRLHVLRLLIFVCCGHVKSILITHTEPFTSVLISMLTFHQFALINICFGQQRNVLYLNIK